MDGVPPDQSTQHSSPEPVDQGESSPASSHAAGALLDALLRSSQDAAITTDAEMRITSWNPAAEAMYGWSAAEAVGKLAHELLQTDYLGAERSQLIADLREHGVWKGEVLHRHRDGSPVVVLATLTWVRGPHGEDIGVLSLNHAISERTQRATGLREHEEQQPGAEQVRQRATERLHALADASRAFAESVGDYQALLHRVARVIADTLRAACNIRLLSDDGQWLDLAVSEHFDPAAQAAMRAVLAPWRIHIDADTPVALAVRHGAPHLVPVIDHAALRATLPPERQHILEGSTHSMMVVPLRLHDRSIGSLMLARTASEPAAFDADDVSLVQDLADRAALAIGNAQLLVRLQAELAERERAQKVTELLYRASQFLARPLGHDEVLNTLLDELQQLIPYDSANIMLPDGSNTFRVRYLRGYEVWTDPEAVKALIFDATQRSPLAQIIATQRSLLIADTHQEPSWIPLIGTHFIGCWMGVPLIANNTLVGIFSIDRHQPHSLTVDDLQLAETLAVSAAVAIERAQLLAELQHERAQLTRRVAERTADLSMANAELARAARLKDEFLANMSHELRTPLNAILGRCEALEEGIYGAVTQDQITSLHVIIESGQHLLTLINDILDLSKIESGQLTLMHETIDVNLVSTMALRMVAQIALVKRIALTSQFDAQVQQFSADERRLKQILVNLLSNAVKFTPQGGRVGLEVRGSPEEQTLTFTVWDTGIGIAADDLPRLFQPFVQLDSSLNRQYTGTGLGLSLVSRLAQALGGSVAVTSTPGQGSRFSVTLPWPPEDQNVDRKGPPAKVDRSAPAFGIALVIEDSATAAAQVTRYLRELGTHVEVHPYGTGTVERAIALQPDVIILDILLPDADGWELLRQIKAEPRTQAIPVVVISVVDEPVRAHMLGAAALLTKPIDRPGLVQVLRAVTGSRSDPPVQTTLVVASSMRRPRILLTDDNEATIDATSDYLRAKGYEVIVARNGSEAIVRTQEGRPDIILMDIQMPGMDGLEAIRRLRIEPGMGQVPIFAVTALAMPGDRERCMAAGADEYLVKPVSYRTLVATIETYRQRVTGQVDDPQT
jgi:PAS domain S-box-containing protein